MKKRKLIYVLLAGLAFTACSNEDQAVQQPQKQSRPLTIEVTENPLIQDGEEGSNSNRAAITTTSTLSGFTTSYVYATSNTGAVSASKDGEGKWTSTGSWPGTDATVNWYAYTSGTFNLNGGTPYINFTVEESAANQKDLLVATASGTYSGTGGNLSFNFDHACAAVRFYVKKSTNLDSYTVSVSSIVLKNVVKQGKYYFGTGAWELSDTRSNYTLLSSAKTLASNAYDLLNGSADNSYLFLIPQTLTPWNHTTAIASATTQTYLEVTCNITGTINYSGTAYIPFTISTSEGNQTLQKGKKYDVKINIGKNSLYSGPNTLIINP